jgi:hypothetical protein
MVWNIVFDKKGEAKKILDEVAEEILPIPAKVATIPGHGCHPTVLNKPQVGL